MTGEPHARVAARVPGAAALGLLAPPSVPSVPAALLADPGWTAERLTELAARHGGGDRRTLATVWWYSASTVLLTPSLAGLVTGRPLSARLADTALSVLPGPRLLAATASAPGRDLAAELREALAAVVATIAAVGGLRPRPLQAVAADALAERLLTLGRAVGDEHRATALAAPLAAAVGGMPVPGYVDVAGTRFVRRVSCCRLYRVPRPMLCTACPRRPPAERHALLAAAAGASGASAATSPAAAPPPAGASRPPRR
ncbi:iron reductase [Geodermatophilus sp. CPCC 206100]|uniref:iron reductase n=1 Tax=Geodermatophilus sp. CPCC 206100 TaxID=3020054 RepID=UPI003B00990B